MERGSEWVDRFRRKRFLIVIGQYKHLAGAERQAILLGQYLKETLDCDVRFLAWHGEGRVTRELERLSIPAYLFKLDWNKGRIRQFLALRRLTRFIRNEIQPDYLLPYIGFNCKIIGLIWRRTGARFTWWNQRDEGRGIHGSRVEAKVICSVPDIVSNSEEGREFLCKTFSIPREEITVINNGIRLPIFSDGASWRNKLDLAHGDVLISMLANLTKYKDHATLLRALARIPRSSSVPNCKLVLAGGHFDTAESLKALAFDLGICDRLELPGLVEDVGPLLAASDLVVHSSKNEGCPNAVLEAMAHGKCVIGTDISGMRQALGPEVSSWCLAPPDDEDCLSSTMLQFVENIGERERIGRLNRIRIEEEFSVDQMARNVLSRIAAREVIPCR